MTEDMEDETEQRRDDLHPLARVIKETRKGARETQENFAARAHLDRGFVGAVERAERNVGHIKMRQLLVGLGMSWEQFGKAIQEVDPLPALTESERVAVAAAFAEALRRELSWRNLGHWASGYGEPEDA